MSKHQLRRVEKLERALKRPEDQLTIDPSKIDTESIQEILAAWNRATGHLDLDQLSDCAIEQLMEAKDAATRVDSSG